MGWRFNLETANWVANILDSTTPVASPACVFGDNYGLDVAEIFAALQSGFISSDPQYQLRFRELLHQIQVQVQELGYVDRDRLSEARAGIAGIEFFALIVFHQRDACADQLSSDTFLRAVVDLPGWWNGIVLQLATPISESTLLANIFPAFETAFHSISEWPGLLVWDRDGHSDFFPFDTQFSEDILGRIGYILRALSRTPIRGRIARVQRDYRREMLNRVRPRDTQVHLVHLSDIHLGTPKASQAVNHLLQVLEDEIRILKKSGSVHVVVTGDVMNTPNEAHASHWVTVARHLERLSGKQVFCVPGNHDVRKDGVVHEHTRTALNYGLLERGVEWIDEDRIGIVLLDSTDDGSIARGRVSERQMNELGDKLDRSANERRQYPLLGLIHHHPLRIPRDVDPNDNAWLKFLHLIGSTLDFLSDRPLALVNANQVISFLEQRNFAAILHGHKHVPRAHTTNGGVGVLGCGSSVGHAATHLSINVVTIDHVKGEIRTRLMGERIPGTRLTEQASHQFMYLRRL